METPEGARLAARSPFHQNVTLGRIDSGSYQRSDSSLQGISPTLPARPRRLEKRAASVRLHLWPSPASLIPALNKSL